MLPPKRKKGNVLLGCEGEEERKKRDIGHLPQSELEKRREEGKENSLPARKGKKKERREGDIRHFFAKMN